MVTSHKSEVEMLKTYTHVYVIKEIVTDDTIKNCKNLFLKTVPWVLTISFMDCLICESVWKDQRIFTILTIFDLARSFLFANLIEVLAGKKFKIEKKTAATQVFFEAKD